MVERSLHRGGQPVTFHRLSIIERIESGAFEHCQPRLRSAVESVHADGGRVPYAFSLIVRKPGQPELGRRERFGP